MDKALAIIATDRLRRAPLVQVAVLLSVLGIAGSLYYVHALFSGYYVTKENLLWVSTQAEVELARYSNALLRAVATGGTAPDALADAAFRFDIFVSRLELFRSGVVNEALSATGDGRALLARIDTIEPAIDPRNMPDWGLDSVQLLAERISAAALVLRDVSLIFLRREAQAERDLLHVLDTSVAVSFACFVVGTVATLFFLRAREQSLRNAQAARAAAEEANRVKSDFLATMSHEIRTPLNAVIGLSNLLGNTSLAPQQRHFVETMEAAGGQLLQVVNDVLDFSRIQAGRVELVSGPVALRSVMDRLLLIVNGLPNAARLHVSGAISADVPARIVADEARLMQILTNLMGNAVKFTRDGAVRLDIGVDAADAAKPILRFAVHDDGPGVPDELRAQIFEPFTQGRSERLRPHAGTGLGLSISRGLARLMGGDITLAPKAERGACFVLTLPLAVASPENVAQDGPVATEASGPLCVLVAEDTPTNQLVVRLMLEGLGHRVHLVGDGAQAVSRFGDDRFDLVILDIQMPVMDGYEAARRIRAAGAHGGRVPILALSAFTQASDRDLAAASGITGFLSKPVRQGDLAAAIARVASRAVAATGS